VPELPEVETTRRGIAPLLEGRRIERLTVRQPRLRWPVPRGLARRLVGETVQRVDRRGKYLLLRTRPGAALLHLGMSGSLRVVPAGSSPGPHDHVDLVLEGGQALRLRDPRRFGALLWAPGDPLRHPLLRDLGPEPLDAAFDGPYLHDRLRGRRCAIKPAIMDSHTVVGVGNIYASEALFAAGVKPSRLAGTLSAARCARLVSSIKQVLERAIAAGGTTLRDFSGGDGEPGYFQLELAVYGRAGEPCPRCGRALRLERLGQRATYSCTRCQR